MIEQTRAKSRGGRNHQFDLLRLFFATLVLLAHAPEITDGNRNRELLTRMTHGPVSLGDLAVDGFFLLSGFLIVQSWQRDPRLSDYLQKRALRIIPGFVMAVVVSTLVVGLLAPGVSHYFRHFTFRYPLSLLFLDSPAAPRAFPGLYYGDVNASLWSISYEFRCYLMVAGFGLLGWFRRAWLWAVCTAGLFGLMLAPSLTAHVRVHHIILLTGEPLELFRLMAIYFVGACYFLYRPYLPLRAAWAGVAVVLFVLVSYTMPKYLEPAFVVFGGYLLFYFAHTPIRALGWMERFPDISYGVYLYGWPVESLWVWYRRGSPWVAFAGSTAICMVLGWMSWHFVERPMLTLKRRPTAPLPVP